MSIDKKKAAEILENMPLSMVLELLRNSLTHAESLSSFDKMDQACQERPVQEATRAVLNCYKQMRDRTAPAAQATAKSQHQAKPQ